VRGSADASAYAPRRPNGSLIGPWVPVFDRLGIAIMPVYGRQESRLVADPCASGPRGRGTGPVTTCGARRAALVSTLAWTIQNNPNQKTLSPASDIRWRRAMSPIPQWFIQEGIGWWHASWASTTLRGLGVSGHPRAREPLPQGKRSRRIGINMRRRGGASCQA